jgi:hypothetical protein
VADSAPVGIRATRTLGRDSTLGAARSAICHLGFPSIGWLQGNFCGQHDTGRISGTGCTIPLNGTVLGALADRTGWYNARFGDPQPGWLLSPGGARSPKDRARPITSLRTAWGTVQEKAGASGRWHDSRHTLITELAESGAGDETITEIAGHVSRQMLSRYSHIRTEGQAHRPSGRGAQTGGQQESITNRRALEYANPLWKSLSVPSLRCS